MCYFLCSDSVAVWINNKVIFLTKHFSLSCTLLDAASQTSSGLVWMYCQSHEIMCYTTVVYYILFKLFFVCFNTCAIKTRFMWSHLIYYFLAEYLFNNFLLNIKTLAQIWIIWFGENFLGIFRSSYQEIIFKVSQYWLGHKYIFR